MKIVSIYPCPLDNQIRHDYSVTVYNNNKIYSYEEAKISTLKLFLIMIHMWGYHLEHLALKIQHIFQWMAEETMVIQDTHFGVNMKKINS